MKAQKLVLGKQSFDYIQRKLNEMPKEDNPSVQAGAVTLVKWPTLT